jgi:hypothetical protein
MNRQVAFDDVQIRPADTARPDAHAHLSIGGLWRGHVDEFQRTCVDRPLARELPGAHTASLDTQAV